MSDQDDQDILIGRAVRRLLEIASQDETMRLGLEAVARAMAAATAGPADAGPHAPAAIEPREAPEVIEAHEPIEPIDEATLQSYVATASRGAGDEELGPIAAVLRRAAHVPEPAAVPPPAPAAAVPGPSGPAPTAGERAAPTARRDTLLPRLAEHTRLKADLCRAAAERVSHATPVSPELVEEARASGCSTWMLDLVDPRPGDLLALAECFEAVSIACDLLITLRAGDELDRTAFAGAVRGLAAVQSALRVAVAGVRARSDEDQAAAFEWLKDTTARERIFVERHMKLDEPLHPADIGGVVAPLRADLEELRAQAEREGARVRGLRQVRYHARRIATCKGTAHDRDKIVEAVVELVEGGLPPSNLELREMLLPILDELAPPEGEAAAYARVIADLEQHRERQRRNGAPRPTARRTEPSDEVRRAAALLRGSELVLIGGERRVESERAIVDAFGLSALTWFTLGDDPTLAELEQAISRSEVSVVIQLIRWSRHRHGDAAEIAEQHGKPFVRIPGGYNPNALARAILDQASERLGMPRPE